jgi:tRNA (guanine-N7-)-methyltransferase
VPPATSEPGTAILAVDVHTPGIGDLLWRVREAGLSNVRVIEGDALAVLRASILPGALAQGARLLPRPPGRRPGMTSGELVNAARTSR